MSSTTMPSTSTPTGSLPITSTRSMSAVFTPPSSCASRWTYEPQAENSVTGGLLIQEARAGDDLFDRSCYPSGFVAWGRAPSVVILFTPGACPSGYSAANLAPQDDRTTAICCPSDFTYTSTISSVNGASKTAGYYGCTSLYPESAGTTTALQDTGSGYINDAIVTGPIMMWAQPITVAYGQDDESLFTTSSIPSTTTSRSTSSTTSQSDVSIMIQDAPNTISESSATASLSTQSSAPSTAAQNNTGIGISTGALAGIVVGTVAAIAPLVGLAFFFLKKKKNRRARQPAPPICEPQNRPMHHIPKSYESKPNRSTAAHSYKTEPDGYWPSQSHRYVGELPAVDWRYELPAHN